MKISFDGYGFNDLEDPYSSRVAKLSPHGQRLGDAYARRVEFAVNHFDEVERALQGLLYANTVKGGPAEALRAANAAFAKIRKFNNLG
jgi:hypothetical protein